MPCQPGWKEWVPVRLLRWLQLAPLMELNNPETVMYARPKQFLRGFKLYRLTQPAQGSD